MEIKPQLGFVVVEWIEEEKIEGEQKRDSGIILQEGTANRLKEEVTHKEWKIVAVCKESFLEAGTRAITARHTQAIPVELADSKVGILQESDIVACY